MSSSPAPTTTTTTNLMSPEPQDSASNHSGHTGDSQLGDEQMSTVTNNHADNSAKRKPFKTEYKSKFTPFDQYAYNEVTDSFVKQHQPLHQDLSSHSEQQVGGLEAHLFEPNSAHQLENRPPSNNEPWYKEVIRRNEKANEYRFKAEGHNSPLLSSTGGGGERADSPAYSIMTDRQLLSPSVAESVVGEKMSSISTSDVHSQFSDQTLTTELSQQQQKRFTPSDYKRDHFIAHMANNNNFNLPKEQQRDSSSSSTATANQLKVAPRRTTTTNHSSRLAGGAAQARSRSQSTRRQPVTSSIGNSQAATNNNSSSATSKSNHTTPTRSAPRVASLASRTQQAATTTRTPATRTSSSTRGSQVTPTTATLRITSRTTPTSNGLGSRATPSSAKTRTPVTPVSRPAPSSTLASRSAPRPTGTAGTGGAKPSPVAAARSTSRPGASSAGKTTKSTANRTPGATSAASSAASSATTAVKSIKSKALAAAKEAGSAAGVAAAATAAAATTAAAGLILSDTSEKSQPPAAPGGEDPLINSETTQKLPESPVISQQPLQQQTNEHLQYKQSEEPNLITTTTEAGNMLADELAQAEKVACEQARQQEHLQQNREVPIVESSAQPELNLGQVYRKEEEAGLKDSTEIESEELGEKQQQQPADEQPEEHQVEERRPSEVNSERLLPDGDVSPIEVQAEVNQAAEPVEVELTLPEEVLAKEPPTEEGKHASEKQVVREEQLLQEEPLMEADQGATAVQPLETLKEEESSVDKRTFIVNYGEKVNDVNEVQPGQVDAQTPNLPGSVKESASEELEEKTPLQVDSYAGSKELVNGLADGLVSAEDRFDSSERDISSDLDDYTKQDRFEAQNYNDEPYSIMPTTASQAAAQADHEAQLPPEPATDEASSGTSDRYEKELVEGESEVKKVEEEQKVYSEKPVKTLSFNLSDEIINDALDSSAENLDDNRLIDDSPALVAKSEDDFLSPPKVGPFDDFLTDLNNTGEGNVVAQKDEFEASTVDDDRNDNDDDKVKHDDGEDDDLIDDESHELIESSPALVSANTTLQDDHLDDHVPLTDGVNESKKDSDNNNLSTTNNNNNNNNNIITSHIDDSNLGMVLEALDTVSSQMGDKDIIYPMSESSGNSHDQPVASSVVDNEQQQQQQDDSSSRAESDRLEEAIVEKKQNTGNELLMNVADLMGELDKKSELTSSPQLAATKLPDEVLLSVDQLSQQLVDVVTFNEPLVSGIDVNDDDDVADERAFKLDEPKLEGEGQKENIDIVDKMSDEVQVKSDGDQGLSGDLLGSFTGSQVDIPEPLKSGDAKSGSESAGETETKTPIEEKKLSDSKRTDSKDSTSSEEPGSTKSCDENKQVTTMSSSSSSSANEGPGSSGGDGLQSEKAPSKVVGGELEAEEEESSQVNVSDDMDSEEQLKLSNHLTNSEDELILAPRNYNYSKLRELSPSRYNEGLGLELMSREEDRLDSTADLGDGSSAAIESPTTAEKRAAEMSAKVPEISSHMFSSSTMMKTTSRQANFSDDDDDDDANVDLEVDLSGEQKKDPIDAAATTFN